MKRLTKRNIHGVPYYPECFDKCAGKGPSIKCHCCYFEHEIIIKLAEYEDLEEQGLLLKLPCKVGDMVYVLEPCHCYNNYKENQNCHHAKTKATKYIEVVRVSKKYNSRSNTNCVKLYERPFKMDYLTKIGKTVFLTKEEAEKALAEMKGEYPWQK